MAVSDQRSIGSLLGDTAARIQQIFRGEVRLAKAEIVDNVASLKSGAALLAVAAILGILALGSLVAASIVLLATRLPLWASALVIAVVLFAIAGSVALAGMKEVRRVRGVPRTMQSLKETLQWPTT
jgi:uncharacterized membrane protein YqjE